MAIMSLLARLNLDKTGFDAALSSAGFTVEKFGKQMKNRLGQAFGAAAFVAFARGIVETGKEIDTLAAKLRITGQEAQKLRLKEKLGGELGTANLFLSDQDLETLRVADRLFIKLRATAEAAFVKFQRLPFVGGGMFGLAENIAKLTGFVSPKPPEAPPGPVLGPPSEEFIKRQERIKKLQQEANEIQDKARFRALTQEQRLNELILEREKILKRLGGEEFKRGRDPETRAMLGKRLAEVNADIDEAGRIEKRNLGENIRQSGGAPGIFLGALRGGSGGGPARTNDLLSNIQRLLQSRGIVIRRTK